MLLSEGDNLTSSQAAPDETFLHQVIGEKAQMFEKAGLDKKRLLGTSSFI